MGNKQGTEIRQRDRKVKRTDSYIGYTRMKKNWAIKEQKTSTKNVHITENSLKVILWLRKELTSKQKEEQQKGNTAFIRYDKLIISSNNNSEKRKRTSPSLNKQEKQRNDGNVKTPSTKFSKINAFDLVKKTKSSFYFCLASRIQLKSVAISSIKIILKKNQQLSQPGWSPWGLRPLPSNSDRKYLEITCIYRNFYEIIEKGSSKLQKKRKSGKY